jgi:hypothetical protein
MSNEQQDDNEQKEIKKKSVSEIVGEVVDCMNNPDNNDQSLRDWYNKPTRNNAPKWTGD